MRVLYLARLDDISGRYSFDNVLRQLFKASLADDPTLSIRMTCARGLDPSSFLEEVGAPGRMEVVGVLPPKNERHLSYLSTEDLAAELAQVKAQPPYDVVVNGQPGLQPLIWNALANRYSQGRYQTSVPVVSHMMWTVTRELMRQTPAFYLGELDLVGESMAAWYGTSIWESQMLLTEWLDSVRPWLSPAAMDKLASMTVAMDNGIDYASLAPVWHEREERRRNGSPVGVFWGGRLTDQKGWQQTLKLLVRLRSAGLDVDATTMFGDDAPQVATWRSTGVPLHARVRRAEMYRLMSFADVVPCYSKVEGYGSAWLEFLAAGMLVVVKRESWAEKLLPDWYPLFVDTDAEMERTCLAVARTWPNGELWTDLSPRIRAWVADVHDSARNGVRFGQLLTAEARRGVEADARFARQGLATLACDAAGEVFDGSPVTLEAICAQMTAMSRSGREFGRPGDMVSPMYLRRCLQVRGWVDVGDAREVRMVPDATAGVGSARG